MSARSIQDLIALPETAEKPAASERFVAPRMRAADRRHQIVLVAAELFSRKGFNGTTTKEIAECAGVSQAIIFRHFPSKEALYFAIIKLKVRQSADRIQAELAEAARRKDDSAFFSAVAFGLLEMYRRDPSLIRLLLFSTLEGHALSDIFFQTTFRHVRDYVRKYIKQRLEDGAFHNVDPIASARAFTGMVAHHAQICALWHNDDVKISNQEIAKCFVDVFLSGVLINRESASEPHTDLHSTKEAN
jgi:AcrR family transcriptional regulator